MKAFNKETGRIGEALAERLLQKKGYAILKRNFRTRFGEIDLICDDCGITVFVEVKTKKGLEFGSPEDMYTKGKEAKVRRMAAAYLDGKEVACRIDVVAVVLYDNNEPERLTHYQNVALW